jgi:hypothetical protein
MEEVLTIDEVLEGGVIVAAEGDVLIRFNREAKKNGAFSAFEISEYGIKPLGVLVGKWPHLEQRFSADVACMQDAAKVLAADISDLMDDDSGEQ